MKRLTRDDTEHDQEYVLYSQAQELIEAAERERNEAIAFIKELNAIKGEHGRVYRARCGRFLAKVREVKS